MKTKVTSTYSLDQHTRTIMDNMEIKLLIGDNPLDLSLDSLFTMAARVNKKRGFLFVSNLLGKHIPAKPIIPLFTSGLLVSLYYQQKHGRPFENKKEILKGFFSDDLELLEESYGLLKKQVQVYQEDATIIGFAETATALGHGIYEFMNGSSYLHTTREEIGTKTPILSFEEEHSHAVDQRCFGRRELLDSTNPVLLVDDEITTGKTVLNIIKDIQSKFPRKEYTVLSILDWRSKENRQTFDQLERKLDIKISCISLLSGEMEFDGDNLSESSYDYHPKPTSLPEVQGNRIDVSRFFTTQYFMNHFMDRSYINETGRFGLTNSERASIERACQEAGGVLRDNRGDGKTLCLGTGEFMYLPMKIASEMGEDVYYHSSTRSPIHPIDRKGYAIRNGYSFMSPEDQKIRHYLYNIPKDVYDDLFFFVEKPVTDEALKPILNICKERGISTVNVVIFSEGSEKYV